MVCGGMRRPYGRKKAQKAQKEAEDEPQRSSSNPVLFLAFLFAPFVLFCGHPAFTSFLAS
jgi:hypothetical protein